MARVTDSNEWFDLWFGDRKSMLETMIRNMASDLMNGYDYNGACIRRQREEIDGYKEATDGALDMFKYMDEKEVNRWCFYDMKKRGVIE